MTLIKELALGNVSRPFNYKIEINMPTNAGGNIASSTYFNTLVKATDMPGSTLTTREFFVDGRSIKLPNMMKQDQTWSCTFYLDDAYYARLKMEAWMTLLDKYFLRQKMDTNSGIVESGISAVTSAVTNVAKNLPFVDKLLADSTSDTMFATAKVTQTAYTGLSTASYKMYNVFPTEISQIKFSDQDTESLQEFTVTFSYSHHEYVVEKLENLFS